MHKEILHKETLHKETPYQASKVLNSYQRSNAPKMDEDDVPCGICNLNRHQSQKRNWIQCTACRPGWYHCSCLGISGAVARTLEASQRWKCGRACSGSVPPNNLTLASSTTTGLPAPGDVTLDLEPNYPGVRIISRIPKGARYLAASKLTEILNICVDENTTEAWAELFHFAWRRLYQPHHDPGGLGRRPNSSLTTKLKHQLNAQDPAPLTSNNKVQKQQRKKVQEFEKNVSDRLSRRVDHMIAEGNIRGAIRALTSETGLAPFDNSTAELLRAKHPQPASDEGNLNPSGTENTVTSFSCTKGEVQKAINSFPPGSAGGPDGLKPIHIKDMVSRSSGDAGGNLLTAITALVNQIIKGSVCTQALPILFGASLCALEKKTGGIRPIAVGNTLRRVAGNVLSQKVQKEMGSKLRPVQLGYGTRAGCEAAIHSLRQHANLPRSEVKVILKGDYSNAFNCLERKTMLRKVSETASELLPYAVQAYGRPTTLFFGPHRIQSACGVQQGDPLGPLLFSLGIHEMASGLNSELNIWYLDDVTLMGDPQEVLRDLRKLQTESREIGLELNNDKSEVIIIGGTIEERDAVGDLFDQCIPGIRRIPFSEATLLGSPLGGGGVGRVLMEQVTALERLR